MPARIVHLVCLGLREDEGEREEDHPMQEHQACERGHAWCEECLIYDHYLTCDVCGRLNCPECAQLDALGYPIRRFIPCRDCIRRGVRDGGMQVCGGCYDGVPVYGCCVRALGHCRCPEHDEDEETVRCTCGRMVCVDCVAAAHCHCGNFQRAAAEPADAGAVPIEVEEEDA